MRVLILYFSGTGNTEFVARYLQTRLPSVSDEIAVDRHPIEAVTPVIAADYDLIYLGFPIYVLDAPALVRKFVGRLPPLPDRGIVLFATMGIVAGNAFWRLYKRVAHTGVSHLGSFAIKMPGSDGLAMLKESSGYVKKALNRDYSHFPEFDQHLNALPQIVAEFNEHHSFEPFACQPPRYFVDTLFGWAFRGIYKVMEWWIKRQFQVDDTCTRCGLCEQQCPVGNITLTEEGVIFGDKCEVCLRCLHQCPAEAIQLGGTTRGRFRWHGPRGDFHPHIRDVS